MTASSLPSTSPVYAVVRHAHRRAMLLLGAEQLAFTLCLVFAGAGLLLITGTQILDPRWLLLLGAVGVTLGSVRFRRRLLPRYRIAQLLDARLGLHDTLSTAWFFGRERQDSAADSGASQGAVEGQLRQAERVAAGVDPAPAFPVTGRRIWALTAALALAAASLFGVRYFVVRTLDWRQALIPVHWEAIAAALERRLPLVNPKSGPDQSIDARNGNLDAHPEGEDPRLNDALGVKNPYGQETAGETADRNDPSSQRLDQPDQTSPLASNEGVDSKAPQQSTPGQPSPNGNPPGSQPAANGQAKEQQPQAASSLMDKMKDAMSSLMAKMRQPSQQGPQKREPENNSNDETKSAGAQKEQAESSQKGARNQQGSQENGSQSDEQARAGERAQNTQGHNSDRSAENGNESHSGVGRQDGAKDLKDAEQQRAMGKLAEIIGKRSANLTGEVMVEVPSGKQQLRTQYSQKGGKHADLGGEINRDEIPLADQPYVREYMEQVHKPAKGAN